MSEDLSLSQVVGGIVDSKLLGEFTMLLGRVVSFDGGVEGSSGPTATIQCIPFDYLRGVAVAIPQHTNVPVCYPFGMRRALESGDVVQVHFTSRSMERWRADGSEGDPQSYRHHALSDAFCVPVDAGRKAAAIGTAPFAARVGDPIGAGSLTFTCADAAGGVAITLTYTPAVGLPVVQTVTLAGKLTGVPIGLPAAIAGTITNGSTTVEIDD